MKPKANKNVEFLNRQLGLPTDYPVPASSDDLLFYIQRNTNKNTVVYNLNRNNLGHIHQDFPMKVSWINYSDGGETMELNYIQNKFAYGYHSSKINNETFEFHFVYYEVLRFFIGKQESGKTKAMVKMNNEISILNNVYVYAEEYGVFPQVKFIELFGTSLCGQESRYQRILI